MLTIRQGRGDYGRLRSRWVLVAALVTMTAAFGLNFSAGAFFPFLTSERDWSAGALGAAAGLSTALTGVLQPVVGRAVDKLGARRVLLFGITVLGTTQLLLSQVTELWQFVVVYGAFGALGFATSSTPPVSALVARWHLGDRPRALAIAATGINLGQLVALPVAVALAEVHGVSIAYAALGAVALILVVPALLVVPSRPPVARGVGASGPAPRSTASAFGPKLLTVTFGLHALSLYLVVLGLPLHAADLGASPADGGRLVAFAAGTSLVSMLLYGSLARRTGLPVLLYTVHGLRVVALIVLAAASNPTAVAAGAVLFGTSSFAVIPLTIAALTEGVPGDRVGRRTGPAWLTHQLSAGTGVAVGGLIHSLTGSYALVLTATAGASALALALLLWRGTRAAATNIDPGATAPVRQNPIEETL